MKTTEMITVTATNIDNLPKFQDERLQKATAKIANIYTQAAKYADEKNREISKVLSDVAETKSYVKDGFKSVADYANTVFGINRQNAYALASAGRVYKDDKAHPELKAMSPSKLAEIANIKPEALSAALESGKITHETTQKALREFAASIKDEEPKKAEVVETYTVTPVGMFEGVPQFSDDIMKSPKTMDEWDTYFKDIVELSHNTTCEIINLPKGKISDDSKKATITRRLYINKGFSVAVEFFIFIPKATPKKSTPPKFTKEQLLSMLAEMEESEKKPEENNLENWSKVIQKEGSDK